MTDQHASATATAEELSLLEYQDYLERWMGDRRKEIIAAYGGKEQLKIERLLETPLTFEQWKGAKVDLETIQQVQVILSRKEPEPDPSVESWIDDKADELETLLLR